jgi:hypothetical protein
LVLLLGAGLAYVAMRDTDKGSVAAPGDTVAAVTTVPGATVEPGAATTEPSGSETPTSDGVATTAHPTFDPACVEQAPSGAMPSIDESAAATLGPLSASPTLTITLPRLAHFQNYETPTAYALRVPGGVLLKVDDYGEAGDLGGTMLVLLGVDGGVRWVRCLPTTYVQGATWDPVQQQVAVLQSPFEVWYPLSLADGTIGEQAVATPPEREWPAQELPALSYVQVPSDTGYVLDVIGVDEAGAELWRDSTLHVYGGEAFNTSTVDGIGLAVGCEEFSDDDRTASVPHMRAYDPADGTVRWDVPGVLDVQFHRRRPGDGGHRVGRIAPALTQRWLVPDGSVVVRRLRHGMLRWQRLPLQRRGRRCGGERQLRRRHRVVPGQHEPRQPRGVAVMNEWDVTTRDGFFDLLPLHGSRALCLRRAVGRARPRHCGTDRAEGVHRVGRAGSAWRHAVRRFRSAASRGASRMAEPPARPDRAVDGQPDDRVQLLAELPPGERTVLVLRLVDEMSVAQTSEVIGASERVVETLTARGLARLGR